MKLKTSQYWLPEVNLIEEKNSMILISGFSTNSTSLIT